MKWERVMRESSEETDRLELDSVVFILHRAADVPLLVAAETK